MIAVGKNQRLTVDAEDPSGFYLVCEDNREAFLPGTLAPKGLKVGDEVEVFIFIDKTGEEVATSHLPHAVVGDFACLKVKDVSSQGAYLDIGLPKDLLVPISLQKYPMNPGEIHLVKVLQEEDSGRLYGTAKIGAYIESKNIELKKNQPIRMIPYYKTPLGYKVLIEGKYLGMVYHNEIFSPCLIGQEYEGTVKAIRPDGQIDALLQKIGLESVEENCNVILKALERSGGKLDLWDKSSPDAIKKELSMSKVAFKKAIGALYKKKLIHLMKGAIALSRDVDN